MLFDKNERRRKFTKPFSTKLIELLTPLTILMINRNGFRAKKNAINAYKMQTDPFLHSN